MNRPLLFLLLGICSLCFAPIAHATTMSNGTLDLQINPAGPTPTPLPPSVKNANIFEGPNYTVDETDSSTLGISSSSDFIDFGPLSPTNPIVRTLTLSVFGKTSRGYQVFAFEDHALMQTGGAEIPDTTCDSGQCTQKIQDTWTNTLTFGFGYSKTGSFFNQFANLKEKKLPQPILKVTFLNAIDQAQLNYKINIAGSQNLDNFYSNTTSYLLVPNL